jgi:hypothetical protein
VILPPRRLIRYWTALATFAWRERRRPTGDLWRLNVEVSLDYGQDCSKLLLMKDWIKPFGHEHGFRERRCAGRGD